VFDSAESGGFVYFVTQAEEPTRVNKANVNDVVTIPTTSAPSIAPSQCSIYGGKLYWAAKLFSQLHVRTADLGNFTGTINGATVTGGIATFPVDPGVIYTALPRGLCVVGGQVLLATKCVGNASRLFYADVGSMVFNSIALTHAGAGADGSADVHLAGAYTDGTSAYFLPARYPVAPTQQYFGAKVTPGSPPTVTYFDIRDDTNVHAMGVDFKPWSDGTNLCFIANYDTNVEAGAVTITAPFLARRNLATLTPATGQDLTGFFNQGFVPETGAFFDGNYYIGCNNAFQATGPGALLKISADFSTFTQYPQPISYPPVNDAFASPTALLAGSTVKVDIRQATKEAGELNHGETGSFADTGNHSVWYLFTPSTSGEYTLTLTSYFSGTKAVVYTGEALGSLSQVAFVDYLSFNASFYGVAGTRYRVVIDGEGTSAGLVAFTLSNVTAAELVAEFASLVDATTAPSATSVGEAISLADSSTLAAPASNEAESVALTDTLSNTLTRAATTAESVALADADSAILAAVASTAESITLAETMNGVALSATSVVESISLADSSNGTAIFSNSDAESITLADTDSGLIATASSASESVTLADTNDGTVVHSTVRQVSLISPSFGLISINSGFTIRQAALPGVTVNEGT
jgi:hypothetical protein